MKPDRIRFIISLVIILLISWADIRFFGFEKTYNLSPILRQAGHYSIFFTTALIGFLNWRKEEKWLTWLWLTLYACVFLFAIVVALAYDVLGPRLALQWKVILADIRLSFIGPIPFLVFYLLLTFTRRITNGDKPVA